MPDKKFSNLFALMEKSAEREKNQKQIEESLRSKLTIFKPTIPALTLFKNEEMLNITRSVFFIPLPQGINTCTSISSEGNKWTLPMIAYRIRSLYKTIAETKVQEWFLSNVKKSNPFSADDVRKSFNKKELENLPDMLKIYLQVTKGYEYDSTQKNAAVKDSVATRINQAFNQLFSKKITGAYCLEILNEDDSWQIDTGIKTFWLFNSACDLEQALTGNNTSVAGIIGKKIDWKTNHVHILAEDTKTGRILSNLQHLTDPYLLGNDSYIEALISIAGKQGDSYMFHLIEVTLDPSSKEKWLQPKIVTKAFNTQLLTELGEIVKKSIDWITDNPLVEQRMFYTVHQQLDAVEHILNQDEPAFFSNLKEQCYQESLVSNNGTINTEPQKKLEMIIIDSTENLSDLQSLLNALNSHDLWSSAVLNFTNQLETLSENGLVEEPNKVKDILAIYADFMFNKGTMLKNLTDNGYTGNFLEEELPIMTDALNFYLAKANQLNLFKNSQVAINNSLIKKVTQKGFDAVLSSIENVVKAEYSQLPVLLIFILDVLLKTGK